MTHVRILHLSDIHYLLDVSGDGIVDFMEFHQMEPPDYLLVAGVSVTGSDGEFSAIRQHFCKLIHGLGVTPDRILVVPNLNDVRCGYTSFNAYFFKPVFGMDYDHKTTYGLFHPNIVRRHERKSTACSFESSFKKYSFP